MLSITCSQRNSCFSGGLLSPKVNETSFKMKVRRKDELFHVLRNLERNLAYIQVALRKLTRISKKKISLTELLKLPRKTGNLGYKTTNIQTDFKAKFTLSLLTGLLLNKFR